MDRVRQAIPIEVLRNTPFEKVDERYKDKPVFADDNAILKKIQPKLKIRVKDLTDDQKQAWEYQKKQYQLAKDEAVKEDRFDTFREYVSRRLKRLIRKIDVQDLMRMHKSSIFAMGKNYDYLESMLRPAWVFRKIELSSWHWGVKSANYNEICDAYKLLGQFNVPIKGFSVEVDTSSSCNDKGYSKYTRTYLDTELAYVIRYKGKHVLTIGFNIIIGEGKNEVHIRQVQCKNKKGNRWMFNLPKNYVEYFIDRFFEAYQGYDIYLIRPQTVIQEISGAYIRMIERELDWLEDRKKTCQMSLKRNDVDNSSYYHDSYQQDSVRRQERTLEETMELLFSFDGRDMRRMQSIYGWRLDDYKRARLHKNKKLSLIKKK